MSVRDQHVPLDRLTALALVGGASESEHDRSALAHLSQCPRCADELARLSATCDDWRAAAVAQADALFDASALESQRIRILDRLAHLGQVARVLPFPTRARDVTMPVAKGSHNWVSVAAAGLIIGLVAGQLLHLVPTSLVRQPRELVTMQAPSRPGPPIIVPAAATTPLLSDDELLDEIEAAVQLRRAQSLRALDALTPTASEFRDWTRR
jgi:anti-sigma factor RsiW